MDSMTYPDLEREAFRMQANRDELLERMMKTLPEDGPAEPMKDILLYRSSSPTALIHKVFDPAFCVIAQGSKEVLVGENTYRYDPYHYLLATIELPVVSQVVEASCKKPYLSFRLMLDSTLVSSVMVEAGHAPLQNRSGVSAFNVSPMDGGLLDAVVRLTRLFDDPMKSAVMAPLIKREIIFRLLMGAQGERLRQIAVLGGHSHRIVRVAERLHNDFDQPLRIEDVAEEFGMSVSGFHLHFKAVTGMSPLQFQKQLRLQEARRLMLGENLDASSAGYRVGYNNASHFNREYKRLFGLPPMQDVEQLREAAL